jgi:hypothetical protein
MHVEDLGTHLATAKRLYYLSQPSLNDWPDDLCLASERFGLFLAVDATELTDESVLRTARIVVRQGMVCLSSWGPDCERVHDLFDVAVVEKEPPCRPDAVTLTAWHDETLEDALWFFTYALWPSSDYEPTCRSWLAVSVGADNFEKPIRRWLVRRKPSRSP